MRPARERAAAVQKRDNNRGGQQKQEEDGADLEERGAAPAERVG
jgi:hypothetical protein